MTKQKNKKGNMTKKTGNSDYSKTLSDIKQLVQQTHYASARSVNAIMTSVYWKIGQRIVKVEQKEYKRADYGKQLIKKLSKDLTKSYGKGFSERNLEKYRQFYTEYKTQNILSTVSGELKKVKKTQTVSAKSKSLQKSPTLLAESFSSLVFGLFSIKKEGRRENEVSI